MPGGNEREELRSGGRDSTPKKKGRRQCQRPKSREETPKEGGGNARERVTALHQYAAAPHKKQGVLSYYLGTECRSPDCHSVLARRGSRAPA
jgi:hypothetical protein